ncbi:MAG: glycosyl transferase [Bacteroidales bacterium]|nr:glycosyl transferase [Bacteroidales bacterium]
MEGNFSPVLLFVYNRPDKTAEVLNSINNLNETSYTDLFIYSDGYKEDNDMSKESVLAVRTLLERFKQETRFRETNIIYSAENKGLAKSIIDGVSEVISRYGSVIVLEDDLVVASDFLRYMNGALNYYKDKSSIWSVSAYTFPMNALKSYKHDVYISGRACSWGWATWLDRWNTIDWDVHGYRKFKHSIKQRYLFSKWGKDLPTMLDAYMFGEIKSWAIRWCYAAFLQNKYTIYPVESRILNTGTDGSGTNFTKKETRYNTTLIKDPIECNFEMVTVNRTIRKEFSCNFTSTLQLWKMRIRWFYKRLINK